jgi:hypothetical protein
LPPQKGHIPFALIAQGDVVAAPQLAHVQGGQELVDEVGRPNLAHFVVERVGDDQIDTLLGQQVNAVVEGGQVEARRQRLHHAPRVGKEGQRCRARAVLPGAGNHGAQQRLVAKMHAVEGADGDVGGAFVIDFAEVSNTDKRLGHIGLCRRRGVGRRANCIIKRRGRGSRRSFLPCSPALHGIMCPGA